MSDYKVIFKSTQRLQWLHTICEARTHQIVPDEVVILSFSDIDENKICPEHIATLACLIEYFDKLNIPVRLIRNEPVGEYLWTKLNLWEYWKGKQDYVDAKDNSVLNLWRIDEIGKDFQGKRISEYLKRNFLRHKDLSAVGMSLTEAYYNVIDHSKCNGNAFSILSFDENREMLNVAICDFGIGIANSVRQVYPDLDDDVALRKAMEPHVTVKSTPHNAGFGLENIRLSCSENDYLWIISNQAALVVNDNKERTYGLEIPFDGTLLFYSISLSHFEDEEIIEDFIW